MSNPILHARHNKKAFEYLLQADFHDWVATTAFYCAMHYAHAVIFPYTEMNIVYSNIEAYYNKHKKIGETKHSVTVDLIQKTHSDLYAHYKVLKDVAHTARYHDYEIPKQIILKVKKCLKSIEEYCEHICSKKDNVTP